MSLDPKLQGAVDRLRIVDVTLKAINASLADNFVPEMSEFEDSLAIQTITPICKAISNYEGVDGDVHRRRSIFEMFAGLRLLTGDLTKQPESQNAEPTKVECAKVECYFFVSYDETSETDDFLDEDALALFAQHNVPFNMWPYWREVVQSACSRMGLPRVVLPTHRLKRSATTAGRLAEEQLKSSKA